MIDLAGSERASATNNRGLRMVEGANINRRARHGGGARHGGELGMVGSLAWEGGEGVAACDQCTIKSARLDRILDSVQIRPYPRLCTD